MQLTLSKLFCKMNCSYNHIERSDFLPFVCYCFTRNILIHTIHVLALICVSIQTMRWIEVKLPLSEHCQNLASRVYQS